MSDEVEKPQSDNAGQNYTITSPISEPYDERDVADNDRQGHPLIRASTQVLMHLIDNNPELQDRLSRQRELLKEIDRQAKYVYLSRTDDDYYARTITNALYSFRVSGEESAERETAHWVQELEHNGVTMRVGHSKPRNNTRNPTTRVDGIRHHHGIGVEVNAFLPHSNIWVRIRTPTARLYADFDYLQSEERLDIAMSGMGFAMSSMGYRIHDLVTDFALECVVASNVSYSVPSDLKERINILDRNILHGALAAAMYPNGADFAVPCTNSPECGHVEEEKISLRRMTFFDRNAFTPRQLEMLSRGFRTVTDKDLAEYREAGTVCKPQRIWVSKRLGFDIAPASLADYGDYSSEWADKLVEMSRTSTNEPVTNKRRQQRMMTYSNTMRALQYRHWVQAVVEREDEESEVVVDTAPEFIQQMLEDVVSTEQLFRPFVEGIQKYIYDNKSAIVAVPNYECPKCKTRLGEGAVTANSKNLVEIEVSTYFFILVQPKLQEIAQGH